MFIKKQLRNRTQKKISKRKIIKLRQGVNLYFLKFKNATNTCREVNHNPGCFNWPHSSSIEAGLIWVKKKKILSVFELNGMCPKALWVCPNRKTRLTAARANGACVFTNEISSFLKSAVPVASYCVLSKYAKRLHVKHTQVREFRFSS